MQKNYRPNVAIFVLNDQGLVLACRRSDRFRSWQVPQGGIDPGESADEAMWRELREEIGTDAVEVLAKLPTAIRYDWPIEHIPGFHGQEQWYYLTRILPEAKIDLHAHEPHEFSEYRWLSLSQFFSLEIGFKKAAYHKAVEQFQHIAPGSIREV